jgi:2-amino-4-hydroxy-6-hydroxymethyldihydropteridine diphosphokinase
MEKVYFGLGSNMGDRGKNIQNALVQLERWELKPLRISRLYETEPFGVKDQAGFYNAVCVVETAQQPEDVLKAITSIELALKREKKTHWGPRTIDIDILLFGDRVVAMDGLTIPHPGLPDRKFVLIPLHELAPALVHPISKKTVEQLLNECNDTAIVRPL